MISNAARTNLVLLAVVAAVGAVLWWRPSPATAPSYALVDLAPQQIQQIHIHQAGGATIQLQKVGDSWQLVAPVRGRADPVRVDRVLAIMVERSSQRLPAERLERYGLTQPLATLQLNQTRLAFGNLNPVSGEQYVLGPQGVQLVNSQTMAPLLTTPDDLRARRLLEEPAIPTAITLQAQRAARHDGRWVLPGRPAASQDDWTKWIDQWRLATARHVHAAVPPAQATPVKLELGAGKTLELRVERQPQAVILYRLDDGLAYVFEPHQAESLLKFPLP